MPDLDHRRSESSFPEKILAYIIRPDDIYLDMVWSKFNIWPNGVWFDQIFRIELFKLLDLALNLIIWIIKDVIVFGLIYVNLVFY